jgi:uncharacterized delta-60 repeat protein
MSHEESAPPSSRRLTSAQWVLLAVLGVALFLAVVIGLLAAWMWLRKPAIQTMARQPNPTVLPNSTPPPDNAVAANPVAAGTLDETFRHPKRGGNFISFALQRDGKILFCGLFDEMEGAKHQSIARFNDDGSLDEAFDTRAGGSVHAVDVQADGRIILAGDFGSVNRTSSRTVARLAPDGQIDSTFAPGRGGDKEARALAIQPDGKILVGGNFVRFNGESRQRIVRLNEDGSVDPGFKTSLDSAAWKVAVQPDGQIIIRGHFKRVNGVPRSGLARLRADGSLDGSFAPAPPLAGSTSLCVQPDGKILAVGRGEPLVRLKVDGSVDETFKCAVPDGNISGIAVDSRYRIIIGGAFRALDDFSTQRVGRLNADGTVDHTFQCTHPFDSGVSRVAVTADDNVIVAGDFSERLLRLHGGRQ